MQTKPTNFLTFRLPHKKVGFKIRHEDSLMGFELRFDLLPPAWPPSYHARQPSRSLSSLRSWQTRWSRPAPSSWRGRNLWGCPQLRDLHWFWGGSEMLILGSVHLLRYAKGRGSALTLYQGIWASTKVLWNGGRSCLLFLFTLYYFIMSCNY